MKAQTIQKNLTREIRMEAKVTPLGQDVYFFGTELECYKLSYRYRDLKKSTVEFSENLNTWFVSFPEWFSVEFSQKIN